MDFFEHQESARRRTWLLIFFFLAAVAVTVVMVCFVAALVATTWAVFNPHASSWAVDGINTTLAWTAAVTLLVIAGGSVFKMHQLRDGGFIVAEMLGGRWLDPGEAGVRERRVLNVVEEMSIASGIPAPPVFILESEKGINAFVSGYDTADAVIGLTAGSVDLLNRDELQGVVGHEISHILNGDMRLNMRLMGITHGITLLSQTGYFLLRSCLGLSDSGRASTSRGSLLFFCFGTLLSMVGGLGSLSGNLIKAAVSRQREFLADSSSVQFTRNPAGIGGALKKIGGLRWGSRLSSPRAPMASHMYISEGVRSYFGFLATHPPLAERVRRIDPGWDGVWTTIARTGTAASLSDGSADGETFERKAAFPRAMIAGHAGSPRAENITHAEKLLEEIPDNVLEAARKPYMSRAVIFALLLDRSPDMRAAQMELLAGLADADIVRLVNDLLPDIESLPPPARLPLADITLPALKRLLISPAGFHDFQRAVEALVKADGKVNIFEWSLQKVVIRHIQRGMTPGKATNGSRPGLKDLVPESRIMLSLLAAAGGGGEASVRDAFRSGASEIGLGGLAILPRAELGLEKLDAATERLALLTPLEKRRFLSACAACVFSDNTVKAAEWELIRAVSDILLVPLPPMPHLG